MNTEFITAIPLGIALLVVTFRSIVRRDRDETEWVGIHNRVRAAQKEWTPSEGGEDGPLGPDPEQDLRFGVTDSEL